MTDTTEHADTPPRMPVSLEQAISHTIGEMRSAAAKAGTDDFFEAWSREVMEQRPLIYLAAVLPNYTLAWVMEPAGEGVLSAAVSHHTGPVREAEVETKTKLLSDLADSVSWLCKETTGQHLHEH